MPVSVSATPVWSVAVPVSAVPMPMSASASEVPIFNANSSARDGASAFSGGATTMSASASAFYMLRNNIKKRNEKLRKNLGNIAHFLPFFLMAAVFSK